MKLLFIESLKKQNLDLKLNLSFKQVHILYSIQYKKTAELIKKQLESNSVKIHGFSQVLGCSSIKSDFPLLLIGSGKFHAQSIAFSSKKPVFIFENNTIKKISQEEIKDYEKKLKAKYSKFLFSDNIGVIFSTKSGQSQIKNSNKIKKQLEKQFPEKHFYSFVSDNINLQELENFPDIEFFVNTSCPGLEFDNKKIINYKNIKK